MMMLLMITAGLAGAAPATAPHTIMTDDPSALIAAEREAMKPLAWMDGVWRGQATTQSPNGPRVVTQTERIGPMLDGSVKLMEGRGYRANGATGFNALAMLSYDPSTKGYTLHSHALGRDGDFPLRPTADGYVWEIKAGPNMIRYTAKIAAGTWTEIGEMIAPGAAPKQFFIMKLMRVGDSAWPGAGAIPPR